MVYELYLNKDGKKENKKEAGEGKYLIHRAARKRVALNFSPETMHSSREWNESFKILKEKTHQLRNLSPSNYPSKKKERLCQTNRSCLPAEKGQGWFRAAVCTTTYPRSQGAPAPEVISRDPDPALCPHTGQGCTGGGAL